LAGASAALALILLAPASSADRQDQRAADLYSEGVKLIRKGRYREGAERVNAALARGATEPVEAQGSETRFLARPYDPYYWLGVAQMETGLSEQALANFEKSSTMIPKGRSQPVLADAPREWEDLKRRRGLLLASLETPTPARVAAPPPLPATPTPFALRLPERTVGPPEPELPLVAGLPEPVPARAPAMAAVLLPASALSLRGDLADLVGDPAVGLIVGDVLRTSLARLDAALGQGPAIAGAAERALRAELSGERGRPVLRAVLEAGLEAHRERRYDEAARLARAAGRLAPGAPQPHLLRAVALGTRWILEGEREDGVETEAREAFVAWRARRPEKDPLPAFLSPELRGRLERPSPVPSHA
jgi:tetratricopeptide (TPR) repeat protein